jgi:hypothetical protein
MDRYEKNTGKKRPKPYTHLTAAQKQEICKRQRDNSRISYRSLGKDNSDIEEIKISLKEGEDALRKSLSFLEQQDNNNINIQADDLLVVRRLINQVSYYRKLQYKQLSLENFFDKFSH